jgi:hypothetical protein
MLVNNFISIKVSKYNATYTPMKTKMRELSSESKTKRPMVLKLKIIPNIVDDKRASQSCNPT